MVEKTKTALKKAENVRQNKGNSSTLFGGFKS